MTSQAHKLAKETSTQVIMVDKGSNRKTYTVKECTNEAEINSALVIRDVYREEII